jgi:hypothetical protein
MLSSSFSEVIAFLNNYAAARYTNVAFLTVLLYDHAITFYFEVAMIWTLPWGLPKIIFLTTRYVVPPMLLFVVSPNITILI